MPNAYKDPNLQSLSCDWPHYQEPCTWVNTPFNKPPISQWDLFTLMGPTVGNMRVGGSRQVTPLQLSSLGVERSVCLSALLGVQAQHEKATSGVRGRLEKPNG